MSALIGLSAIAVVAPPLTRWLPDRTCQVHRSRIAAVGRERAALRWGVELGLGVCTFSVTPALFAFLAMAVAQNSPGGVVALCILYGFARGSAIMGFSVATDVTDARTPNLVLGVGLKDRLAIPLLVACAYGEIALLAGAMA